MIVEYKRKASRQELIERIEELEKEIEELKEKDKEKKAISQAIIRDTFIDRYISKDKVRNLLKEYINCGYYDVEQVLKELLEEN